MMQRLILIFAMVMSTLVTAQASEWSCRNMDAEVSCHKSKCVAKTEGFTPMDVTLKETGYLNICAYSGCWEGAAILDQRGNYKVFTGADLKWSGTTPDHSDFAVVLDTKDRIAVLKGAGFAHPLTCKKIK